VFGTLFATFKGFLKASARPRVKLLRATARANRFRPGIATTLAESDGIDHALIGAIPSAVGAKTRFHALACLAVVAVAP